MNEQELARLLQSADDYFRSGKLALAEERLTEILRSHPENSRANELLAYIAGNTGDIAQAFDLLTRATQQANCSAEAFYYLGSLNLKGNNFEESVRLFGESIKRAGPFFEALHDLGTALARLRDYKKALESYKKAEILRPNSHELRFNIARAHDELKQYDAAILNYDQALSIKPDYAEAWSNKGVTLHSLEQYDEALVCYQKALELKPNYPEAWLNKGVTLQKLRRLDEALMCHKKALDSAPDYPEAWFNKGITLRNLDKYKEALTAYDKAIDLKPDYYEAWSNKGSLLQDLKRHQEAFTCYEKSLSIKSDYAPALVNKGVILNLVKRYEEAIIAFDKALKIKADSPYALGALLHSKMLIADWSNLEELTERLISGVSCNEKVTPPFPALSLTSSEEIHYKAARIWSDDKYPANHALGPISAPPKKGKIRIGYFSADFHNHPISYLTSELFAIHNRESFEVVAFSLGPSTRDEMRMTLERVFDEFIDVQESSDREIAQLARNKRIDIAIDLGGLTQGSRPGIFSYRSAPIQASYLGYPATMGTDFIDYLIADRTVIPQASQAHYAEKIAYLPDCYMVRDSKRPISEKKFSKIEFGLPERGFVFCCFNNSYKISPDTLDSWAKILREVQDSVLWLSGNNQPFKKNLKKEAGLRGIDPRRLIFAEVLPSLNEHLARHHLADLFIDTLPYNAHTTASDALWAGLPVLTCIGEAFAGRVAASLLHAIHLPELIARNQEEYEELAVELATNEEKLTEIRQKLAANRLTAPLFDTRLFAKHIEAAYQQMHERHLAGLAPDHLYVIQ